MQNLKLIADEKELARQEEFLQRDREYTQELKAQLGRTPTYHVTNFGCQMIF